jgi:hypothetical protein
MEAGGGSGSMSSGGRLAPRAAAGSGGGDKRAARHTLPSRLRQASAVNGTGGLSRTVSVEALHNGNTRVAPAGTAAEAAEAADLAPAAGSGVPGATQYKGVRINAANRFECSACVESKQLWLGTYPTIEAVRFPASSPTSGATAYPSLLCWLAALPAAAFCRMHAAPCSQS